MSVRPRHLQRLLEPQSIAIVGLSSDPTKHGRRVLRNLQNHGYAGEIWGVNPKQPDVPGIEIMASVGDLPEPPDILVLTVPASVVPDVLAEADGSGVAIVFAGGFAEAGAEGAALQEHLVDAARRAGVRLLGPNSGGVIQPGLPVSFLTCLDRPADQIRSGPVGLVTQSGGTGSYLHNLAAERGSGFAASISTGNEVDLGIADGIAALADHPDIRVIAVVMESVRSGAGFVEAVRLARAAGKRVVATRIGTTAHGQSMLHTHTAALAHPQRVIDGALWSLGVPSAATPQELLDVAEIMARVDGPRIESAGIVTHSGGVAILLADLAEQYGVTLPPPPDSLVDAVTPLLEAGAVGNPLDMGGIIGGPHRFAEVVDRFAGAYDAVLAVSSAHPPAHSADRVESLLALETGTPVIHLWMAGDLADEPLEILRSAQAPVTEEPRAAIRALAALTTSVEAPPPPPSPDERPTPLPTNELEAKQRLATWGIPTVAGSSATDLHHAQEVARRLGYPVVVKALAPDLLHKTDIGAVIVDVRNDAELEAAVASVADAARHAGLEPTGVLVEGMAIGPEVLVSAVRNETFGAMVAVGHGGRLTEAIDEAVMALAPLTDAAAHRLVDRIPGLSALTAPRRGSPADLGALARIVTVIGGRLAANPLIEVIEINPLTWAGDGWCAVDAVML